MLLGMRHAVNRWLLALVWTSGCLSLVQAQPLLSPMVDQQADPRTSALYRNLFALQGKGIMFGHQDALAYGIGWRGDRLRSDVASVSGSFPAVFGWELSKLGQSPHNIDKVDFDMMRQWIRRAYQMGGVITIGWHLDNPVTKGSSWDHTPAVPSILAGGIHHDWYKRQLDFIADFMQSLRGGFWVKHPIPVIFRPFHEHNGGWFWWGRPHRTPEDYQQLWRFTVEYLRDVKEVHNLLYVYSPDVFDTEESYLEDYPGDEYVDILGLDDYADFRRGGKPAKLTRRLRILGDMAIARGKLFALTETGSETIPHPRWWTDQLLKHVEADPIASMISWMLVWRNGHLGHYFAPFPGHPSADNFVEFRRSGRILMVDDLPDLYQ